MGIQLFRKCAVNLKFTVTLFPLILAACGGGSSSESTTVDSQRAAEKSSRPLTAHADTMLTMSRKVPVAQVATVKVSTVTVAATVAGVTLVTPTTRDALTWPFSTTSIWNTPIGSNAVYVYAQLPSVPRGNAWAAMPQIDDEIIVTSPTAPSTPVAKSTAGWSGANRCGPIGVTAQALQAVPLPQEFVVPNSGSNNSAAILASDGRTILQSQPFTRCTAGQGATALVSSAPVDLYGPGTTGSHGGSGLSAIGGSLRLGELRPGGQPPRHALKIDVDAAAVLHKCSVKTDCYRWPAITADSYATSGTGYGTLGSTSIPAGMKMGALLAIPTSVDLTKIGFETAPGQMLAWTLQNYGAYIVDSTGGGGFAIEAENGANGSMRTQFAADWGYPMEAWVANNTPWVRDIQRIQVLLALVDNNTAATPGGGGTALQPLAPALAIVSN